MERLVFVHGSVLAARGTWGGQQALADRFELVLVDRPGFPPNPPIERVDFDADAELVAGLLEPGDHLVGHSYGGVISLLTAAAAPDLLASLTVIEPPATRVAAGQSAADAFAERGQEVFASAAAHADPETFLRRFLAAVGSAFDPPSPLTPELEQCARALMVERGPWEAEIPLDALASAAFPKLVVSGAHHPAFDAICDVLEERLSADRVVLEGYGHTVQRHPKFNDRLAAFVSSASRNRGVA